MPSPTIRVRLDRALIDELKALAGEDADIAALIEDHVRVVIARLRASAERSEGGLDRS